MYILLFQLTRHFFTPSWLCHQSLSPPPMLMTSHSDWSMTGLRNLPGISHHSYTAGPEALAAAGAGSAGGGAEAVWMPPFLNLIMGTWGLTTAVPRLLVTIVVRTVTETVDMVAELLPPC